MAPMGAPDPAPYADAAALFVSCLDAMRPPRRIGVAEWAEQHRRLANTGGGFVGRWSFDEAPYLRAPMEALLGTTHLTVAIAGPGQCGKTEVAHNWMLWGADADPADMLWYMQTEPGLEAHVKTRIEPMLQAHPSVRNRMSGAARDDTLHFKRLGSMAVEFLSATTNNLINKRAGRIVADEVDAYDDSFGDVKTLLDVRRQTYGRRSKILMMSHADKATGLNPGADWTSGIMGVYADSDRRLWYWACPHCQAFSSPCPTAAREMVLVYPEAESLDVIEAEARLLCPVNGCLIEDRDRRAMNLTGRWVGMGEHIDEDGRITGERVVRDTAGFWITGLMSTLNQGIGKLARNRVKAERDALVSGDHRSAKEVITKQWGWPFGAARAANAVDAATLADRCEDALHFGEVPEGVRFITGAADAQSNRFELLWRGWGEAGESWILDREVMEAAPATVPEDWDAMLERLFLRRFPLADGSGREMGVRGATYDSGGEPGVTEQAYDAWRRWKRKQRVRRIGMIEGKDAWQFLPYKGESTPNAPRLQVTYPDNQRRDRKVQTRGDVPLMQVNPNTFKDDMAAQLARAMPGPRYVHLPMALRALVPPHPLLEQLCAETRKGKVWTKTVPSARNEMTDLMVMSHAAARLHGLHLIAWENPPAWAAPWERNSMVTVAEPDADAEPEDAPVAARPMVPVARPMPAPVLAAARMRGVRSTGIRV